MNFSTKISPAAKNTNCQNTPNNSNNKLNLLAKPALLLRWFFILLMFISAGVNAQTISATTYPMTTASSVALEDMSTGTTNMVAANLDDNASAVTNIGFEFWFVGVRHTQFSVNANGLARLGGTVVSTAFGNDLAATANTPTIAPYWDDLYTGTNGQVHFKLFGVAPNRKLVVEWQNMQIPRVAAGNTGAGTFQMWLSETSGKIDFVYGTGIALNTTNAGASIGFNTSASLFASVTASTNAVSYAAVNNLNTAAITSGTRYTFTPINTQVSPTTLSFSGVGLSSMTLNWLAASPTTGVVGYAIYRSIDGVNYTFHTTALGSGTTSLVVTGLTPATNYWWQVYSYSEGTLSITPAAAGPQLTGSCSISGIKTVGGGGADYTNLTNAVAALVAGGVTGPVILELNNTYPGAGETFPIVLGAVPCASALNNITIRLAAGAGAKTISASNATGIFNINGGNFWTIDGRQGGTGSVRDLTIVNTSGTSGPAIQFINEASNNTVRYTNLQSALASATSGVVVFSTTTGANGNDNNTIDNNRIDGGAGATASPIASVAQNGVYSLGTTTTAASNNSGNTISNNEILNNFVTGAATTCAGILVGLGNTDWTINANSIYQTAARLGTVGIATVYGISIANSTSGNNFIVTNNFIGGSAAGATGSAWSVTNVTTHFANRFNAIGLSVGTTTASSVQGNIIRLITFSSNSSASTNSTSAPLGTGVLGGIMVGAGSVNVGTTSANTIGSASGTGSINLTVNTNAGGTANGIGIAGSGIVNVSNNIVAGITTTGGTGTISTGITGIISSASGTVTINNNTIGSTTIANSINASLASTGTTVQVVSGIVNTGAATALSITNNTIANLNNAYVPAAANTSLALRGISSTSGVGTVTGNTIRNLFVASNSTGTTTAASVIGISYTATTAGNHTVSNNTIYDLKNNVGTAVACTVTGIYYAGPTAGTNIIAKNLIYGTSTLSSSASALLNGIVIAGGASTFQNNMIRLGYDAAGVSTTIGLIIVGMDKTTTANNKIFHNTVYVGGTGVLTSSSNTLAFRRTGTGVDSVVNNIFINQRSNAAGTAKHYSIGLNAITTLTNNYNLYHGTGTGFVFGYVGTPGTTDYLTRALWVAANPVLDANSPFADPCLVAPIAATPNLRLTNCATLGSPADGSGISPVGVPTITDDFDAETRATLTPTDIGADAGIYGPAGLDVGITALVRPTATSCHSATEDIVVTLRNFSTQLIDFALNPVIVTVNVTGTVTVGPLTVTINSGTLAAGATQPVTFTAAVSTTVNGAYTFVSSATDVAATDVTPGNNSNTTNITIAYTALSAVAVASPTSICISGAASLTATPTGGTAPYTYLWDAGTALTSAVNNTGTITSGQTYNVTVTDACGVTAPASVAIVVNNPTITGSTGGQVCGTGTVNLSATASAGATINWYASNSSTTILGSGTSFTTPSISIPTSFFAEPVIGLGTISGLGNTTQPTTTGALNERGIVFTATQAFTLVSAQYFSPTLNITNTVTVRLYNQNTSTQIGSNIVLTIPQGGTAAWYTMNLNLPITPGNYRLTAQYSSAVNRHTTGVDFTNIAWNNLGPVGTITSGYDGAVTSTAYMYFHNIEITAGCSGTRVAVLANRIAPPAITLTNTAPAICVGQTSDISVSSTNDPAYTYSWTSAPAGFTAATAGPHTVTPAATTIYTVNAVDNTAGPNAGCATSGSTTVTVSVYPTNVTATATPTTLCVGGTVSLTSTGSIPGSYAPGYTMGSGGTTYTDISVTGTSIGVMTDDNQFDITFPAFNYNGVTYTSGRVSNNGWLVMGPGSVGTSGGFSNAALPQASTAFGTLSGNAAVLCPMWDDLLPGASTSVRTQQVGSKFILQWDQEDNFNATGVGTITFQIQMDQSNGKIYFVYPDVTYGDVLADAGLLATVGLNFSSTSALQYSNNTASLVDGQIISFTPNLTAATNFSWVSNPAGFTANVRDTAGVIPAVTPIDYTVTVSNNGCSVSATTATVNLSTLIISAPAVLANVLCKGQATGSISAVAQDGTPIVGPNPYTYTITGPTVNTSGLTTGIFTGLLAGNYTITATDAFPCSITSTSVTITEPAIILSITASGSTPLTCRDGSNGTITAAAAGGTGAYTYTIAGPTTNNSGAASGTFTGLSSGSYTITVTDANGCTATTTPATVLTNPAALPITASNSSPVCAGQNVNLSITETYVTYAWTGPVAITNASSQSATATAPANGNVFKIVVTDANGCSDSTTTTVSITPLSPVSVTIAVSPGTDNCAGTPLTFTATPVNGGGSPTYKWYINAVEQLGETASTYLNSTAVDQDVVTCQVTSSVTCVSGNPATSNGITLTVSPFVTTDVTLASNAPANTVCAGTSVTFTATPIFGGASPTYQFFVNAVSQGAASATNTFSYVPVNGDAVTVEITSSLTCSLNGTATSTAVNMTVNPVPAQPTVTAGGPVTFCNGGSVTLTSSFAGAGNQWYNNTVLMPGETNDNLVVTTSGSYTVIYTALACASPVSAATVVTVNANPTATITGTANFCTGLTTTLSAATSTAGSGTISTYQWYEGANPLGTSVTQVVTIAGSYTVVVTNSNTCATTSAATVVVENAVPTASVAGNATICTGTTEILTATATAGSGTIVTYQWKLGVTNVGANNAQFTATLPGSYTVTVTNSNGCSTTSAPFVLAASGPLAGDYTIGSGAASCTNYLSFATAIGDLNTKGVSGVVTFNIASAYTETAPVGGLIINYCALSNGLKPSATNTVSFMGGAIAATISSQVGTSLTVDGIVKLVGADYITFNKINLLETATNVTATTQMEWGYALLKCDGNDGSNNNTISNCSITLNKANTASVAIYSGNHIATATTGLTYTGTAGDFTAVSNSMNGRNTFRSNAIQNVYGAFSLNGNSASSGTYSLNDTLNFVGITGAGNTITNFGGAATLVIVINQTNQRGYRVKNNTITGGTGTTSAVTGISMTSGVWGEIINNTIQLTHNATTSGLTGIIAGFTGGDATNPNLVTITGNIVQNCTAPSSTGVAFTGITSSASGTSSIINISSNTVQNNSIGGTGTFIGVANSGSPTNLTMSSNTITGNTKGSTGTMSLMSVGTPTNSTVNNNSITNNLVTGGSATVTLNCVIASTSIYTFNGNTISNNRVTGMGGSSIATVSGYTNSGSPTSETITNNNINNLFVTGAATPSTAVQVIRGFQNNTTASGTRTMSSNTISDLYSSSTLSAGITGIISATGGNVKIFKNKICNLFPGQNGTSLAFAKGISITGGTTDSVYNNLINIDLAGAIAPAADAVLKGSDAVKGIEVTGGTTVKLYNNTIRLAGNGTTNTFGTSGISLTSTTPLVDIRNNIVVNLTTGGALAAANAAVGLRRTSTIALNATGYAATSNNNIWYTAGTAAAPFYYDGTTAYNTFLLFKAQVTARETASQTENVAFQSTACGNANMLKVNLATPTFVEGGAQAIANITDDYFGTVRNSSSPDIGAHEDNFINLALVITSVSASPSTPQCVATARTITAVLSTLPVATSVTLNYSFAGVAQTPVNMTLVSGSTYTGVIPAAPTTNVLVTWSVTATDGTYTPTATGTSYTDAYLTGVTIATSANPTTVCSGSPSVLTAVITGPPVAAPAATAYCTSLHTGTCAGDGMLLVQLGTINNVTPGCGASTNQYTYYNGGGSQTTNLAASVLQTLTVSFDTDGSQFFGAWIDYDRNGVYNSTTEFLGASANAGASGTISITFTVPLTALNGLTHMRIVGGNDAAVTSSQACGASSSTFGETQDYDVTITGGSNAGPVLPGSTFNSYVWRDALNNIVGTATNPTTVNPAATETYTLTATDVNGCVVISAPVTVSIVPLVAVNITQGLTSCASGVTLTANTTGGGAPYTYVWSDGSATVYPNTQTITTGALTPGIYTFTVNVTDGCGGNVNMSLGPVTVNPLPTVAITSDPANGLVCGDKVTMTASGASTYAWSPAAGLNVTTGAVVFATPTVNTTYVVTGTDANGCTNTASQLIQKVVNITMSATPPTATLCAGSNLQLNSTATSATPLDAYYTFSASTGVALADTIGSTRVLNPSNDDTPAAGVPFFSFTYEGVAYSHFSVSPDGWVNLRTLVTAASSDFTNNLEAPTNNPQIAALWDDNATGSDGYAKYLISGVAPFRILTLHWFVAGSRVLTTSAANASFQILLYETSNKIEYRYGTIALYNATPTLSVGLTSVANTGGFMSVTTSTNTNSNVTVNNSNATAPPSGTMYTFTYAAPVSNISLSWSPATNLNSTTINNPLATNLQASVNYVLTATNTVTGCSVKDTVVVTVNPLPASTFTGLPSTICSSASAVTLVGNPAGGTFSGPGMSGPVFTPSAAGPGTHTIQYSFTDLGTGCSNATSQQVIVTQPVVSFTGLPASVCIDAAAVTLTGNQAPGGTFTGPGITDNANGTASFNPAATGAGVKTIVYSYTDGNGCFNSTSQNVTVNPLPVASFTGLALAYCSNNGAATLTGTPVGGTFSGTGIVGNTFDPAVAGVGGPYTITYTFTNGNGCTGSQQQTVSVNAFATISLTSAVGTDAQTVCINNAIIDITYAIAGAGTGASITAGALPAGVTGTFAAGVFTISGTPTASGVFNYTVTTSGSVAPCPNLSLSGTITVNANSTISLTSAVGTDAQTVCINSPIINITYAVGLATGASITSGALPAGVLGSFASGVFTISGTPTVSGNFSYEITTSGGSCLSASISGEINVNALPVVSFSGLAATYCSTDPAVTLTGSPVGGTFSGTGIVGNTFDPAVAGIGGPYTITYSYTDGNGCSNTSTQQVSVTFCTPTTITVNLKLFLQGYYDGASTMKPVLNNQGVAALATETDTVTVELHDATTFALIDAQQAVLSTTGLASATFTQAAGSYYIAIKHRNTVQTWSTNAVACTVSTPLYDFSTAANQAYGDNQVEVSTGVWAFFTGDMDQDEFIDGNDFPYYDIDSFNGVNSVYVNTDLDGDGFVDGNDYPLYDVNSFNGVSSIHP